jgi:hypothetical protein
MGRWPKLAYYWPTDSVISASDAIEKREGDNRTGVLWCHEECYKANPQNGNALFARRGPGNPHFWIGTGNFIKSVDCDFEIYKSRNSESYRYSQVLHDLFKWLNSNEVSQELGLTSIQKTLKKKGSDISINHIKIGEIPRVKTYILIRDKNRKRTGDSSNTLTLDISQWPDSHVQNFENHAKRLFLEEWERLNHKKKVTQKAMKFNDKHATKRTKRTKRKSQNQLIAEILSVDEETINMLDDIRSFLISITKPYTKGRIKEFKKESVTLFGDTLSSNPHRRKYVSSKILNNLDYFEYVQNTLQDASDKILLNHDRRGSPKWMENWDKLLMSLTHEDFLRVTVGDNQKIKSKYQSQGGMDFEQDVKRLHGSLISKNTPFFDFVAPEGVSKGYVKFDTYKIWCLYKPRDSSTLTTKKVGWPSSENVDVLFAYDRGNYFFKELFQHL